MIEPSHFDARTAWLVIDAHRLDDLRPYLWRTTDLGRTWKRLDGGLPREVYLHSVKEDPAKKGLLYLGTERGVAFSRDDGATWHALRLNLPTVAVHDLVVKDDKLVLGTHGRSMWIFDDLKAVREPLPAAATANGLYVYPVSDAVRWLYTGATYRGGWTSPNPASWSGTPPPAAPTPQPPPSTPRDRTFCSVARRRSYSSIRWRESRCRVARSVAADRRARARWQVRRGCPGGLSGRRTRDACSR
jgi:hypothetical protein